jgi:glycosyltransferase involved in cell wall biosynthesis
MGFIYRELPKKIEEYNKPLISFLVLSYNQEHYIEEALNSAFSQTYEPLEVIISDDFSSDKTFEIIKEMVRVYEGKHRLILNRNDHNLGLTVHINHVANFFNGVLLICSAGDDISLPERTTKIYNAYLSSNLKAKAIYSDYFILKGDELFEGNYFIDEKYASMTDILKGSFGFLGAVSCYHRDVFECFEPLSNTPFEDTVLGFRAAILGGIKFIPEKLVKYRRSARCISNKYDLEEKSFNENSLFLSESISIFLQSDIFMLKDYLFYSKKFNFHEHFPIIKLLTRKIVWKLRLIELIEKQYEFERFLFSIKILFLGVPLKNIIEIDRSLFRSKFGEKSFLYKISYPFYKFFKGIISLF